MSSHRGRNELQPQRGKTAVEDDRMQDGSPVESVREQAFLAAPRSLDGFTVGITADRRWEEQAELIERRGARIVHGPTIRTIPLVADVGIREATQLLLDRPPDWLVAITGIGIRGWLSAVESWGWHDQLVIAMADTKFVARGPKAAGAVTSAGLALSWTAPGETLDDVVAFFATQSELHVNGLNGVRIAVQLHGDDGEDLTGRLRALGADVVAIPVYRWTIPEDDTPALRLADGVIDGTIDALTFTSAPAVRNFFLILERSGRLEAVQTKIASGVLVVCVGPVCSEEARSFGVADPLEPKRARLGSMIRVLTDTLKLGRVELCLGGVAVVVQGSAVMVEGEKMATLTDRERSLFEALLARKGQVVARSALLRQIWGSATADPHALEVTVARLRRRLGAAGSGIRAVPRRGYILDITPVDTR